MKLLKSYYTKKSSCKKIKGSHVVLYKNKYLTNKFLENVKKTLLNGMKHEFIIYV